MRKTEKDLVLVRGSMPAEQERISAQLQQGVSQPEVLFWQYDQAVVIMGCSQRINWPVLNVQGFQSCGEAPVVVLFWRAPGC